MAGLCNICGKPAGRLHTCTLCGNIVCDECMYEDVCKKCLSRKTKK
ncbi:hypothetical protein [Methanooceanicella nereidis]|nr:hypothetical protein [Methanocella sp. CWC-04]